MISNMERQFIGTWGEFFITKKLLEKRGDIFKPLVDSGIDLLIRLDNGKYNEIQVKTVSKACKDPLWFQVTNLKFRENFFIICVSELQNKFWVIPSKVFYDKSTKSKNNTIFDLNLAQKKFINDTEIQKLENNLSILLA